MNKQDQRDMIALVVKAIEYNKAVIASLEKEKHNPTVAPLFFQAKGRLDAFESVLEASRGDNINLRVNAGA